MESRNENLRDACQQALDVFGRLNSPRYDDIRSKLEFVIGSYNFDKNPVGLFEFGEKALELLKGAKSEFPRKINKQVIENLEKRLTA